MAKKLPVMLLSLIPQAVSAITTIIKDKREKRAENAQNPDATVADSVADSVKDIVSGTISSKRLLNIGGTTLIITLASTDIASHGLSKLNLALIAVGALYSLGMSLLTAWSERVK